MTLHLNTFNGSDSITLSNDKFYTIDILNRATLLDTVKNDLISAYGMEKEDFEKINYNLFSYLSFSINDFNELKTITGYDIIECQLSENMQNIEIKFKSNINFPLTFNKRSNTVNSLGTSIDIVETVTETFNYSNIDIYIIIGKREW